MPSSKPCVNGVTAGCHVDIALAIYISRSFPLALKSEIRNQKSAPPKTIWKPNKEKKIYFGALHTLSSTRYATENPQAAEARLCSAFGRRNRLPPVSASAPHARTGRRHHCRRTQDRHLRRGCSGLSPLSQQYGLRHHLHRRPRQRVPAYLWPRTLSILQNQRLPGVQFFPRRQ